MTTNNEYKLEFSDLLSINTKDSAELRKFLEVNKVFAFIRYDESELCYLHFFTSIGYQFALATQKRRDREYKIKTFKNINSAIKDAKEFGVSVVMVLLSSAETEFMLAEEHLAFKCTS